MRSLPGKHQCRSLEVITEGMKVMRHRQMDKPSVQGGTNRPSCSSHNGWLIHLSSKLELPIIPCLFSGICKTDHIKHVAILFESLQNCAFGKSKGMCGPDPSLLTRKDQNGSLGPQNRCHWECCLN
ncbi:hypothetical protein ACLOJK_005943 [Asimina triloba]